MAGGSRGLHHNAHVLISRRFLIPRTPRRVHEGLFSEIPWISGKLPRSHL